MPLRLYPPKQIHSCTRYVLCLNTFLVVRNASVTPSCTTAQHSNSLFPPHTTPFNRYIARTTTYRTTYRTTQHRNYRQHRIHTHRNALFHRTHRMPTHLRHGDDARVVFLYRNHHRTHHRTHHRNHHTTDQTRSCGDDCGGVQDVSGGLV